MTARLHIRLLGGFEITLDGHRLSGFKGLRLQRFIALVILRGGAQQRSRLAFELWPNSDDAQARTNLRKLLHEFRLSLPNSDAFIEINSEQIHWREEAQASVDVLQFRKAMSVGDFEGAASAYGGDLLPACYEDWLLEARSTLRIDALAAMTKLIEEAAKHGNPEAVLVHSRRVLEFEPTDEKAIYHLIEAYRALGERNAAMRAFHRYSDEMERELGVAPGEKVCALYRQVRSGFSRSKKMEVPEHVQSASHQVAAAPFVGRGPELAALQSEWRFAREGSARLALVTGEPGIGKSRLVQELGRRVAAAGDLVVAARAYEAAGRLPWGPVVDLLRSESLRDQAYALDPVWRAELSCLLPELADHGEPPARPGSGDPAQRHRLFDAVKRALISPDRPSLLVVDDLQWCDSETIEMIGFVIRSQPTAPVLIVGTFRTEELPDLHPLNRMIDAFEIDGVGKTVPLKPLDEATTATLAARMRDVESVGSDFAQRLWTQTTGNPLFLVETLRAGGSSDGLHPGLTPTMRAVMRARIGRLSEGARRIAEMGAVIGRAFSLDLIEAATGTDQHTLIDAVDELWQRRIISEQGVRYDFSHDKMREVVLEMINSARRRLLHRTAADALAKVRGNDIAAINPQLAAHYHRAGMIEPAIDAYRSAGAQAAAVSAFEEAVDHFRHALKLLAEVPGSPSRDRLELDIRIAFGSPLVALEGYGSETAHQLYERCLVLCRKLNDPIDPPILRGLGLARLQGCRFADCDEMGRALVEKGVDDPVAMTEGRYLLGVSAFWQGDLDSSHNWLESALQNYDAAHRGEHLSRFAQDPKAVCMVRLALTELWQGDPGGAAAIANEAQTLAADIGHLMTLGYVITYAAIGAAETEDQNRLAQLLTDGEELWKRFSMRYLSVVLQSLQGWTDLLNGDRRGIDRIHEAVERSRADGENLHLTYTLLLLARAHEKIGDIASALSAVQEGLSLTTRHGQLYLYSELCRLKGELSLAIGETQAAKKALSHAISIAKSQGAHWPELKARTSFAQHYPRNEAHVGLQELMDQISSGHELAAFRAAEDLLERAK